MSTSAGYRDGLKCYRNAKGKDFNWFYLWLQIY